MASIRQSCSPLVDDQRTRTKGKLVPCDISYLSPLSLAFKWLEEVSGVAAEAMGISGPWLTSLGLFRPAPGALSGWLKNGVFSLKDWLDQRGKLPYTKAQTIHRKRHLCSVTTPAALLWLPWKWLGTEGFLACGPGTPLGPFLCLSCLGVH